jgi:hypothetical protein
MFPSRRTLLAAAAGLLALPGGVFAQSAQPAGAPILKRRVPQTGTMLPVVGIGTAIIFDFQNDPAKLEERKQVVRNLVAGGGSLIDTAAGYGNAEAIVGQVVQETGLRGQVFIATKYSSTDTPEEAEAELQRSLQRLRTTYIDLQQAGTSPTPISRWRSSRRGRRRAIAAISASRRAATGPMTPWPRWCGARSRNSSRSTIRWATATPRSCSCPPRWMPARRC